MTASAADIDLINRALSQVGGGIINSLEDPDEKAVQAKLHYASLRRALLRSAPWAFARTQGTLPLLPQAPNAPWSYKYAYPPDCVRFRRVLGLSGSYATPQDGVVVGTDYINPDSLGWDRQTNRFLVISEDLNGIRRKVILSNVAQAIGEWTADVTDPGEFDPSFEQALESALASKLVMPISGNAGERNNLAQIAHNAVDQARVDNAPEGFFQLDHTPDWILARGFGVSAGGLSVWGDSYVGWDNTGWGT